MRFLLQIISFISIMLPAYALACSPMPMPSDSKEPVTVKIENVYFQIPESYLPNMFLRVPMSRDYIQFSPPIIEIMPKINAADAKDRVIQIQILNNNYEGSGTAKIKLNDAVTIKFGTNGAYHAHEMPQMIEAVTNYIKLISSEKEPANWRNDSALALRLGLGIDACSGPNFFGKKPLPAINYNDIIEGMNHRNEAIRWAATYMARNVKADHKNDVINRLLTISYYDKSPYVRATAVESLGEIAKYDKQLIPQIITIMTHDKSDIVHFSASQALTNLGDDWVEKLIPEIENGDQSSDRDIGNILKWMINHEVTEKKIISPEKLSGHTKTALNELIIILKRTKNPDTLRDLLSIAGNSHSAIATNEFIAMLNKHIEDKGASSGYAAIALSNLGENAYGSIPLIIKRMDHNEDTEELDGLIQSFYHFGEHGKAAIPLLITFTTFNKKTDIPNDHPIEGIYITSSMIRSDAITALRFMKVRTPEVKAAFEAAAADRDSNISNQAKYALDHYFDK